MNLHGLKKIIDVVESIDPNFEISTQLNLDADLDSNIGYIYIATEVSGALPDHPALVLRGGMLAIDLSWEESR